LALYKSEREVELARQEEIQDKVKIVKRVTYPLWAIAIIVNSLLVIGYHNQDKLIRKNSAKLANIERTRSN